MEWCRVMPSRARLRDRLEYERVQVFVLFVCARCWRWIVYRSNQIFIIFDPYPSHTDPFRSTHKQVRPKCERRAAPRRRRRTRVGRIGRPLSACLSPCLSFSALPTCVNNSRLERHEERVAKGRKVDSDEGHRQEELRQLDLGESPLRDQCDRVAAARLVDHCTDEKRAHNREAGARADGCSVCRFCSRSTPMTRTAAAGKATGIRFITPSKTIC